MPDQLQLRGGTTSEHNSFTGVTREVTVDTTKKTLVVHDGSQAGGTPLMKESGSNHATAVGIGTGGTNRLNISSSEVVFNDNSTDTDFRIEGNGNANLFVVDAGNDKIGIGTSAPQHTLTVRGGTDTLAIQSDHNAASGQDKGGILGLGGKFNNNGGINDYSNYGEIRGLKDNNSNNQDGGYLSFYTKTNGIAIAERMRITTDGRVGIGTAGVSNALLAVNGRCHVNTTLTFGTNTTLDSSVQATIYKPDTNMLAFATAGNNERMRIDNSGYIGIGTTTQNSVEDGAGLKVDKYVQRNTTYHAPDGYYGTSLGEVTNGNTKVWASIDAHYAQTNAVSAGLFLKAFHQDTGGSACGTTIKNLKTGNALTFNTVGTAASINNPAVETERMRIHGNGFVGIGTNDPKNTFHLHGDGTLRISPAAGANQAESGRIRFTENTSDFQGAYIHYDGSANKLHIGTHNGNTTDAANDIDCLTILRGGTSIGVGTDDPQTIIHAKKAGGVVFRLEDATDNNYSHIFNTSDDLVISADRNGTGTGNLIFRNGGTSERMRINANGVLCIGSTNYSGGGTNPGLYVSNTGGRQVKIHNPNASTSSLQITNATTGQGEDAGTQLFTQGATGDFHVINKFATGDIAFATTPSGGSTTEVMRIQSTGNVGIGTTSPSHLIHAKNDSTSTTKITVESTGTNSYPAFRLVNDARAYDLGIDGATDAFRIYDVTGTSERMRIDTNGNIGIGTTSPSEKLDVSGDVQVTGTVKVTGTAPGVRFTDSDASGGFGHVGVNNTSGSLVMRSDDGNSLTGTYMGFEVDSGERMRISSDGNLGIGTTTPIQNAGYGGLTLNGSSGGLISFKDSNVERGRIGLVGENNLVIQSPPGASSFITFNKLTHDGSNNVNGATELARFDVSGHFLVGTTSSNIGINAATEGVAIREEGHVVSRGTSSNAAMFTAKTTDTGGSKAFRVMLAQTEIGSISMGAGGTAFNTSSDYRRKENVVTLTDAITRLKTLTPKRFNFKTEPSVTRDGFLAHEVTAVPEAVTGTKDAVATESDVTRGVSDKVGDPIYQQLDQSKLVPLLTAALQEAVSKIETLEAKVAALEAA